MRSRRNQDCHKRQAHFGLDRLSLPTFQNPHGLHLAEGTRSGCFDLRTGAEPVMGLGLYLPPFGWEGALS